MAATTASLSMNAKPASRWSAPIKVGLLGGTVAIYLSLVGILTALANRAVITGVISLGQVILLGVYIMFGYMAAQRAAAGRDKAPAAWCFVSGALAGVITSAFLVALVVIAPIINLREIFINASPELWNLLTFGLGVPAPYQLKDALAFLLLVLVLIFRPTGILGERLSTKKA